MPFTFAHPAIILPLSRSKYFSLTALVIGSIIPDFEYFIRMKLSGRYSHTLQGVFLFDLPVALVLFLVFHLIVKRDLLINVPNYFRQRLHDLLVFRVQEMNFQNWLICITSALIGVFSHLLWDNFTHKESLLLTASESLLTQIKIGEMIQFPLYQLLQHLSTLLGGTAVLIFFHKMPSKPNTIDAGINKRYWYQVIGFALVAFSIRLFFYMEYLGDVVVSIIGSLLWGLVLSSGLEMMKRNRKENI